MHEGELNCVFYRVLYYENTGELLYHMKVESDMDTNDVKVLMLHEKDFDSKTQYIEKIVGGTPVIKQMGNELSEAEIENKKLKDDILLLQTDNQAGGIL